MADPVAAQGVLDSLAPDVRKAVDDAFMTFADKLASNADKLAKSEVRNDDPKAWFADPFNMLDSIGMGYRNAPTYLTYDTLRQVGERNTAVASIIFTRLNQLAAFAKPQANRYSVGFVVRPRFGDKKRRLTDSEKERVEEITYVVMNTGREYNVGRDDFDTFIRKFARDSLVYDQGAFETVLSRSGKPYSFHAVAGDTMRVAQPKVLKGTPPHIADLKKDIRYVQLINSTITAEFNGEEMAFCVRNPRTHVKTYGYGLPEIEVLMTTITSHLWAEEWNRRLFSQGSTIKGLLNIKGNVPQAQFESFKRQWYSQVGGVSNAWKTPILNGEEVQFVPLQMNNTEMGYQFYMEYLIKVTSAIFQIDPSEINFDLRGGVGQQPVFMSTNEAQQKVSKDRGLTPLLNFVEKNINRFIVWRIDPRFEFAFVGIDAKTEEQAIQLRMQQVQNIYTLNEVRAMEDLPALPDGDIVLNPTYTGYMMQKAAAAQQQAMGQQQAAQGGAPQPGSQPGAAQQGPGAQPQLSSPSQPYAGQFNAAQPGDEEKAGAEQLRAFNEKQGAGEAPPHEDSESVKRTPIEKYIERIHADDWSSTSHKADTDDDLRKSEELYELVPLD